MKTGHIILILLFAAIISSCEKNESSAPIKQSASFPIPDNSDAVDMGLSVKWAPFNIGASEPSGYGNYYAWGETEFKESYTTSTYKHPTTDELGNIIESDYDVASLKWGNGWRLPSKNEIDELEKNCKKEECTIGDVRGLKYTGPNGNSIFLPAAGYVSNSKLGAAGIKGYYTSGSNSRMKYTYFTDSLGKEAGISVRPVIDISYDIVIDSIIPRIDYYYPLMAENGLSIVFNAYAIVNTDKLSSHIDEYGVAVYKNNELYSEFSGNQGWCEIRIESKQEDLDITVSQSGAKIYSTKNHWSIGTYYVKKNYNGKNIKYYGNSKKAVDFEYYSNSIKINSVKLDSSKIEYIRYNNDKLLDLRFRTSIEIDTVDNSVRDYGIVIYKNNEIFSRFSAQYGTGNVDCILFAEYSTMKIDKTEAGEYTASTLEQWSIGSFIERRNSDNFQSFYEYHDNIIPLDLTYKKKPSLSIKTFTSDNLEYMSLPNTVKSHINLHIKVDGGFFLKNVDMTVENEHIYQSNNIQIDSLLLPFEKLLDVKALYHQTGYWNEDATFLWMSNNIISYLDSSKDNEVSREATISVNTYVEHDNTKLSTKKLRYKLLHNSELTVEFVE